MTPQSSEQEAMGETLVVKAELEVEVAQLPDPADPDVEPSWPSYGTCTRLYLAGVGPLQMLMFHMSVGRFMSLRSVGHDTTEFRAGSGQRWCEFGVTPLFLDLVAEDGRVSDLSFSRSLGPIRTVRALSHPQEQRVNGP